MGIESNRLYQIVKAHADSMLEVGRDPWPDDPSPLFAGVIDVGARQGIVSLTIPPPGIRTSDYNWCGNNLMHDLPFLEALDQLTSLTGDQRYAKAVEDVITFYGANCPHPKTGLFPWGEHAQWSFADKSPLNCGLGAGFYYCKTDEYTIHDHLRFAPQWFWERMWDRHPDSVVRFAHGLDMHIMNHDTFEHNRHGPLAGKHWNEIPYLGQGKDFARHAGHYIFECAFAYRKSGDSTLLDWARRKLAWHLDRRLPNGIISGCVRTENETKEGQHDSLALALWDAAAALGEDTPEGREFGDHARDLFDARARLLKDAAIRTPEEIELGDWMWMTGYFRQPRRSAGGVGVGGNILLYYRAGMQIIADAAVASARWAHDHTPPPPQHLPVLAKLFSGRIAQQLTAHDLTGEQVFLDHAAKVADWCIDELWRNDLFMGAGKIRMYRKKSSFEYHLDEWAEPDTPGLYTSVSGVPMLIRNLLRLALKQEGVEDALGVDLYSR